MIKVEQNSLLDTRLEINKKSSLNTINRNLYLFIQNFDNSHKKIPSFWQPKYWWLRLHWSATPAGFVQPSSTAVPRNFIITEGGSPKANLDHGFVFKNRPNPCYMCIARKQSKIFKFLSILSEKKATKYLSGSIFIKKYKLMYICTMKRSEDIFPGC